MKKCKVTFTISFESWNPIDDDYAKDRAIDWFIEEAHVGPEHFRKQLELMRDINFKVECKEC